MPAAGGCPETKPCWSPSASGTLDWSDDSTSEASPESASLPVTGTTTGTRAPVADEIEMTAAGQVPAGGARSTLKDSVCAGSAFPARAVAPNVRGVAPSDAIVTWALLPATVAPPACAPVVTYWSDATPLPAGSSTADSAPVGAAAYQPAAFAGGVTVAVVTGGVASAVGQGSRRYNPVMAGGIVRTSVSTYGPPSGAVHPSACARIL